MNTVAISSPLRWFGGKNKLVKHLIPLIPPHKSFLELFAGGASFLFSKPRSVVETINNLDHGIANFYRVLQDDNLFDEFYHLTQLTPYSREQYYEFLTDWNFETDPARKAWKWFTVARQSFSGRFGSGISISVESSGRGMARTVSGWLSCIDRLPDVHERSRSVQVENQDFRKILDRFSKPEAFVYADPPYIAATRTGGEYQVEMNDGDHRDLVGHLLDFKGKVMLSGYASPLYEPLVAAGWNRKDIVVSLDAAKKNGEGTADKRVESVWMNYDPVVS